MTNNIEAEPFHWSRIICHWLLVICHLSLNERGYFPCRNKEVTNDEVRSSGFSLPRDREILSALWDTDERGCHGISRITPFRVQLGLCRARILKCTRMVLQKKLSRGEL